MLADDELMDVEEPLSLSTLTPETLPTLLPAMPISEMAPVVDEMETFGEAPVVLLE